MENLKLHNKVAIITGAGSGIGKATAILFAKEGANVVINYNNNKQGANETLNLIKKQNKKSSSFIFKADITNRFEIEAMVKETIRYYDQIDILVNNSGSGPERINSKDNIIDLEEEDWNYIINVNLKGVFLTSKHVLPFMIKQRKGSIVNISSIFGTLGWTEVASYCASKGGIVTLTKQMAINYGQYNIRVNCLSPGFTRTNIYEYTLSSSKNPESTHKFISSLSALNRVAEPDEIAKPILFLASEDSSFITGINLLADGGFSAK